MTKKNKWIEGIDPTAIITHYESALNLRTTAAHFGASLVTIRAFLFEAFPDRYAAAVAASNTKRYNAHRAKRLWQPENPQAVINMRANGATVQAMADAFGVSKPTIISFLKRG